MSSRRGKRAYAPLIICTCIGGESRKSRHDKFVSCLRVFVAKDGCEISPRESYISRVAARDDGTIRALREVGGVQAFRDQAHIRGLSAVPGRWSASRDHRRGALREPAPADPASAYLAETEL